MHDHDELTRLAERVETLPVGDWDEDQKERDSIAAELRTIAQQQGKAGGVVSFASVLSQLQEEAASGITTTIYENGRMAEKKRCIALLEAAMLATPQPAEQHAVAVVHDAMVSRARRAYADARYEGNTCSFSMRAALTAALAPQPKDAT